MSKHDVVAWKELGLEEMRETLVGVPAGSPGKARLRLPPSSGEQRLAAMTAGVLAIGRIVTRPAHRFRLEPADELGERQLALIFVAVIAGHQEERRTLAIADDGDQGTLT